MRPLQKGIFLPPALFANAHLLLNKLRFAAELKNKNLRFLQAVSSYAKLSRYIKQIVADFVFHRGLLAY